MEEELAESQDSPEDAGADGDNTQMTESRKGDGEGGQQVWIRVRFRVTVRDRMSIRVS